ncbi:MAG: multicopper oxidase domain-containing protein [Thermodesulfovibrionales bacterium]|jgi:FtsP/CotA-like multicopper oxidase with cupredoxin domain
MKHILRRKVLLFCCVVALLLAWTVTGNAAISGVKGKTFNLTAKSGYITTPDGNNIFMWGYALNGGTMQYPGPTLIVNQGAVVTVRLTNQLSVPVSITFPGQGEVTATGGIPGLLAREAPPGATVEYQFRVSQPGTYMYHSGTRPELQIEMGLVGAIIVRPMVGGTVITGQAYTHPDSQFDHQYLFLLTELDPHIHTLVEQGRMNEFNNTVVHAEYWMINGRAAPDTLLATNDPTLPSQPYGSIVMAHPREKVLMRIISAGRDPHPFHNHGNHATLIAHDGRLLESVPGAGADLGERHFTTNAVPGETYDLIFTWTGENMGWDFYGHTDPTGAGLTGAACVAAGVPLESGEPLENHCKPIPVSLPTQDALTFGQFYSGSPFLGALGALPPGEGGFNPNGGYFFMWHSHAERELTNFDIFPGGMLTFLILEHPNVVLSVP